MKFSCDRCQARYQIPDEKVAGKRLRYTCRKCEHAIVLDGTAIVVEAGIFDVSPSTETLPALAATSIPPSAMPGPSTILASKPRESEPVSTPAATPVAEAVEPMAAATQAASPLAAAAKPGPTAPTPRATPGAPEPAATPVAAVPKPTAVAPKPSATPLAAAAKPAAVAPKPAAAPIAAAPKPAASAPKSAATPAAAAAPKPAAIAPKPAAAAKGTDPVVAAPRPAPSSSMPELPVWHVAIAGTPVGPLRRSELVARAERGEVTRASLAWREGLADWKAVAEIPELAVVIPAASAKPTAPPIEVAPAAEPDDSHEVAIGVPAASEDDPGVAARESDERAAPVAGDRPDADETSDEPDVPAAIATPVPSTAPAEPELDPEPAPARADSIAPVAIAPRTELDDASTGRDSEPLVAPRSSNRGAILGLMVGAAALVAGAFSLGRMSDDEPDDVAHAVVAATPSSADAATPSTHDSLAVEDVGDDTELAAYAGIVDAGSRRAPPAVRAPATTTTNGATGATTPTTTDDSPLPMPVAAGRQPATGASDTFDSRPTITRPSTATGPLDATQISAVVRANRTRAQRCYERAATMSGSAPDMRLSVTVRIATSGTVSDVSIDGNDFGGVVSCVERIVRTWQFPASTTGGQSTFSLVFSGG